MAPHDLRDIIELTSCHDTSIGALGMKGDHVHLEFEDVWLQDEDAIVPVGALYGKGTYYGVTVDLRGVRGVTRNDETVSQLSMESEVGEVLTFERSGQTAKLVMEWVSFTPQAREICVYTFSFEIFELHVERQEDQLT
jgi:hypothetical protein